jgi:hypothetical protein
MLDKDPTSYSYVTYLWVLILSAWGGIVSWNTKRKNGDTRPFNFTELIGEIVTSAFAGVITFYLCEAADLNQLITPALVGISGHMGSKIILQFEKFAESWANKRLNTKLD